MIRVGWRNHEKTQLIWKCVRGWTDAEFFDAVNTWLPEVESRPHDVSIMMDMRQADIVPKDWKQLLHYFFKHCPGNVTDIIVISTSDAWMQLFDKVYERKELPFQLHHKSDYDTARLYNQDEDDPTDD